jgi:hypothetical protein
MAYIKEHKRNDGSIAYEVRIRREGLPRQAFCFVYAT